MEYSDIWSLFIYDISDHDYDKQYLRHCLQWLSQLSQEKSEIIEPQRLPADPNNYKT